MGERVGNGVSVAVGMGVDVCVGVTGNTVGVMVGAGEPNVQDVRRMLIANKNRFISLLRYEVRRSKGCPKTGLLVEICPIKL